MPARTAVIVAPLGAMRDRAGTHSVVLQQLALFRALGVTARLVIIAPRLRPGRPPGPEALNLGNTDIAFTRTRFVPLAMARTALNIVQRRPFGPEVDLDLADMTIAPGGQPADLVLSNTVAGSRIAPALGRRTVLLVHDLPPSAPSPRLLNAIAGHSDIIAISHDEAVRLASLIPNRPILPAVPVEVATEWSPGGERDLLFVGGAHPPNREGLGTFVRECFLPLLAPLGVRLAVAGRAGEGLHDHPQIELLRRVEDLAPLYASAKLAIVPLLRGTGLSLKTAEALSMGKAILATPVGLRGLGAPHELGLPPPFGRDWADKVLTLLRDDVAREASWRRLARAVRGPFMAQTLAALVRDTPSSDARDEA